MKLLNFFFFLFLLRKLSPFHRHYLHKIDPKIAFPKSAHPKVRLPGERSIRFFIHFEMNIAKNEHSMCYYPDTHGCGLWTEPALFLVGHFWSARTFSRSDFSTGVSGRQPLGTGAVKLVLLIAVHHTFVFLEISKFASNRLASKLVASWQVPSCRVPLLVRKTGLCKTERISHWVASYRELQSKKFQTQCVRSEGLASV